MSDHIIVTLAEQSDICQGDTGSDSFSDNSSGGVSFLVSRMLIDAGYPDVARAFGKMREVPLPADYVKAHPWNIDRIHNVVRDTLPLSENARHRLIPRIAEKLQSLKFTNVGDALITELAEHILAAYAQDERDELDTGRDWLAPTGYWSTRFPEDAACLITDGVLAIQPGTDLFPAPRGALDLSKLNGCHGDGLMTELELLPRIRNACTASAEALKQLLQESSAASSPGSSPPGHLVVKGIDEASHRLLDTPTKACVQRLSRELESCIRTALKGYRSLDLIVSVQ